MNKSPLMKYSDRRISPYFHKGSGGAKASVECRIRADRKNSNGLAAVYLQIIINGKRTTVPLQVSWPIEHFDNKLGKFLHRQKNDQLADDLNMEVVKEKGKINSIFMYYRHSDQKLTIEVFKQEYRLYGLKKDFLVWTAHKVQERYNDLIISKRSWANDRSELNKLRKFRDPIPFSELNERFLKQLEGWLLQNGMSINYVISIITTIKNYARLASKDNIVVNMQSLFEYKMPQPTNRIIFIGKQEMDRLEKYYRSFGVPDNHKKVLAYFLFACHTGLRFSDIKRVNWKCIHNNMLIFIPYKGRKKQRYLEIPLIDKAFSYIHNTKGNLFETMSENSTNRILKEIAKRCEIRKHITTHVARHTFATEFLRRGGSLEVLQRLLGHYSITTTMIYVHVDRQRLINEMELFAMSE